MAENNNLYTLLTTNHLLVPQLPQETLDRLFGLFHIRDRDIQKIFDALEIDNKSTDTTTTMNAEQLNIQIKAIVANLPHTIAMNLSGYNLFEERKYLRHISDIYEQENKLVEEGFRDEYSVIEDVKDYKSKFKLYKKQEKGIKIVKIVSEDRKNSLVDALKEYSNKILRDEYINNKTLRELQQKVRELEQEASKSKQEVGELEQEVSKLQQKVSELQQNTQ
ncbi:hypothetical protein ABK040_002170 [Willaertia magna]